MLLLSLLFLVVSCQTNKNDLPEKNSFKYWVWTTANKNKSDKAYEIEFEKYAQNGIDAVLINTNTDPKLLDRLVPIASAAGLEVHAWIMSINRPGDAVAEQHPEWYAVSRDGKSCYDNPPYVGYYKWMCPTREASRNHVLSLVAGLADVPGVASVHLDYIRYSDIYLPVGLLPKYDLVQDTELPEFDFCYCEVCVAEFQEAHHRNPLEMAHPEIDIEWKQFRLNKVKSIVDEAYEIVHAKNKALTAAVFPYPEMADHMVRQRWDKWNIDAVLPMIYNSFYNEGVDWIGFATAQGVQDLKGKNIGLHTGIYVPPMSAEEVAQAIVLAKDNGANGVSFFDGNAVTEDQWTVIRQSKK
ncbi:MAG: hypothetical protein KIH80_000625 [Flavobacteriia bacterium]|nr:hypothetical protein [Flavobacteriia bacterium]